MPTAEHTTIKAATHSQRTIELSQTCVTMKPSSVVTEVNPEVDRSIPSHSQAAGD